MKRAIYHCANSASDDLKKKTFTFYFMSNDGESMITFVVVVFAVVGVSGGEVNGQKDAAGDGGDENDADGRQDHLLLVHGLKIPTIMSLWMIKGSQLGHSSLI